MFFFIDNSEFRAKVPFWDLNFDYFVMGGLLCNLKEMKILEQEIANVKKSNGIPEELPIKWNIKDLKRTYKKLGKIGLYKEILLNSDRIRLLVISSLSKTNSKLVMSATPAYDKKWRKKAGTWAFINVLQRIGHVASEINGIGYPKLSVIMDWPEANDKSFFQTYSNGYYLGEPNYHCGPLKQLHMDVNLMVSSTLHSPHLQMVDLCVGITKDFIRWCYCGRDYQRVKKFFPSLLPFYRRSDGGKILGYGLVVGKSEDYEMVENKIKEISEENNKKIPF